MKKILIKKFWKNNKIVVSNKNDFKYFIGYKDAKKIRPLLIILAKMSAFRRDYYKIKCMAFLIKDKKLLEKYEIWKKVCNIIKKELFIKPVYNKQYLNYLKTKIKVCNKKINTDFLGNKIPKKNSQFICF